MLLGQENLSKFKRQLHIWSLNPHTNKETGRHIHVHDCIEHVEHMNTPLPIAIRLIYFLQKFGFMYAVYG